MILVAFALIIFFAVKTRRKMDRYDKSNILWDKEHIYDEQPPNVEEWVSVNRAKHFKPFIKFLASVPNFFCTLLNFMLRIIVFLHLISCLFFCSEFLKGW